jgi:hypothetical protein
MYAHRAGGFFVGDGIDREVMKVAVTQQHTEKGEKSV